MRATRELDLTICIVLTRAEQHHFVLGTKKFGRWKAVVRQKSLAVRISPKTMLGQLNLVEISEE